MAGRPGGPRDGAPTGGPGDEFPKILEDIWQWLVEWGLGKVIGIVVVSVAVIWLLTGIYIVGPGEVGVVRQFGREVGQTGPGLNYHIPWPFQRADVVNMAQIRRAEIGFRTVDGQHERELEEALMLTGDENIADIQVLVQYRVKDASQFLFEVRDPERALHTATEVALRGVIGKTTIDDAMTVGRPLVEADTLSFCKGCWMTTGPGCM